MRTLKLTVLLMFVVNSIFAQGVTETTPILVWVGAMLGILWAAWSLFGQIAKITKTTKDDDVYNKGKEFYDKIPDFFKTSNGDDIVRK